MSSAQIDRSAAPAPGPLKPFRFPPIERFVLSNGLPVLFSPTEGLPVTSFSLLLPGGALREPASRAGVATLTGSTLESGTRSKDAAEIARALEAAGVRLHIGASWEVSHVDFTCLTDRAVRGAQIAAELMTQPSFPPDEVERIRNEMLAGIMQRRAEPRSLANEMANRFIFAGESPYSRPIDGSADTVRGLSREDVLAFHENAFIGAAALVVSGRMSVDEVRSTAESAFGGLAAPRPLAIDASADPYSTSVQVVVIERPGAVQSEIRIGHVGAARSTPDYFPILVMNTVLGGAFTSRLNLNLRERHGFTYGVSSSFVMRRSPGPFLVSTAVQTEVTGRAVSEILTELSRIREHTVTAAELDDARQYLAGTYPLRLQTTEGVASRLSDLFVYELPDSYLEEFALRVLEVTSDEVQSAAQMHIRPEQLLVLVVGAPDQVVPQLEALGIGPVQSINAEVVS